MLAASALIGAASAVIGLLASFHLEAPTGPSVILAAGAIYILSLLLGPQGGLLLRTLPRRHLEA